MKTVIKILSVLLTVFTVSAQPYPNYVIPCGVQKGQELDITVTGKGLQNIENAVFYEDGVQFLKIVETKKNQVKFKIKVDKDCELGLKHFRLFSKDNFSEIISLSVGQFPSREEKEDNGSIEKAEKITHNITIDGIIKREDIDYFKIKLQKGENLKLEVEANRLSHRTNSSRTAEYFDTHLGIYNKEGFLIVDKDDTTLTKLDPHLEFIAPENDTYYIAIRSSEFAGHNNARYRLHIGNFPRPIATYPAGGQKGKELKVKMISESGQTFDQTIKTGTKTGIHQFAAVKNKLISPSPIRLDISNYPEHLEVTDNDEKKSVKNFPNYPVVLNGIIEKDSDVDWWGFTAKKGSNLRIEVLAHKLGTGLDSILEVYNEKGQRRKRQDDSGSPDAVINYKAEYDGKFFIRIRDQLGNGRPHYVYRIKVTDKPTSISLSLPSVSDNNQLGQEIRIPQGGKSIYLLQVNRDGSKGKDTLVFPELPQGVSYKLLHAPEGKSKIPVLFTAAANAPHTFTLAKPSIKSENKLEGELNQEVVMVKGRNNRPYKKFMTNKLAVGVTNAAPITVTTIKEQMPLPHLGYTRVKIKIERKGDFKGDVKIRLAHKIDGMSSIDQMTIKADKTELDYTINSNNGTPVGDWPVVFTAAASHKGINYIISSDAHVIKVIPSFFSVKMAMQSYRQGDKTTLDVDLENLVKFSGKAKVQLHGAPSGVKAESVEVTADAKKLSLPITVDAKTRKGQHKNSFLAFSIPYGKGFVYQNIRTEGVIRVDPPAKNKPKVAAAKTKKKLSRLEELRLKSGGGK